MDQTPKFKVVSFFTKHNEYAEHALRLSDSLERFNIPNEIHGIDHDGPWELMCALKAFFVLECWRASDVPIVWLDADATVEQYPEIFAQDDCDFAVHKWEGHTFGSGTVYFGKSPATERLIEQWALRCEADPATWDQVHLQSAWCDVSATTDLRTKWLPQSYLQIFDETAEADPVVLHWQASRKQKEDGRTAGTEQLDYTALGEKLRALGAPWRSAESAFWIQHGVDHIKPEVGQQFPEGFDVGSVVQSLVQDWPMLEIGCGVGRIASCFNPDDYVGADVNPTALLHARQANPEHLFRIADRGLAYPSAHTALIYTVLLHISDVEIGDFLDEAVVGRKRVIIAELMDQRWRRDGDPPVFNRDPEDYILMMASRGFSLAQAQKHEYERYAQPPWNTGRDSRITFLAFDRVNARRQAAAR